MAPAPPKRSRLLRGPRASHLARAALVGGVLAALLGGRAWSAGGGVSSSTLPLLQPSFVPLREASTPATLTGPGRRARLREGHRAVPEGTTGGDNKDTLANNAFMMGMGFDQEELEAVAAKLAECGSDKLWDMTTFGQEYETRESLKDIPKYDRWLSGQQLEAALQELRPGTSSTAASALLLTISGGSGFLQKAKVQGALDSWRGGEGGGFDAGAFGLSMLGARAGIAFSFWFLNVFAPFCSYFFFLRPPLKIYAGIDLLPGVPEFWSRG